MIDKTELEEILERIESNVTTVEDAAKLRVLYAELYEIADILLYDGGPLSEKTLPPESPEKPTA